MSIKRRLAKIEASHEAAVAINPGKVAYTATRTKLEALANGGRPTAEEIARNEASWSSPGARAAVRKRLQVRDA